MVGLLIGIYSYSTKATTNQRAVKYHPIFKNMEKQKWREARALKEVETPLANKRKLEQLKQNKPTVVPNSARREKQGRTRDKVAKDVGFRSGHEIDVEIRNFDTLEEIEFIIDDNSTREKTKEQKSKETRELKRVEVVLA